jgi:CubicO group peptidase (beta-lactamase class C family)
MSSSASAQPLSQVASWPVTDAAAAVVNADGVLATYGRLDAEFEWASVTKLLTALAVLGAVQQGLVALDEPAGPPGATVRHLLAHASGIATDDDTVLSAPGRRRVYSNRGFDLLGELVETRAATAFPDWLQARVCRPLELGGTRLDGSPAHGARGPLRDLARLGHELLRPTLLPAEVMAVATSTAFPGLTGVLPGFGNQVPNDWGLGFEIRDGKAPHWTGSRNSPRTFGHFGRAGSFLWVDPVAGLACASLADRAFGPWAMTAWPRLSDDVLDAYG